MEYVLFTIATPRKLVAPGMLFLATIARVGLAPRLVGRIDVDALGFFAAAGGGRLGLGLVLEGGGRHEGSGSRGRRHGELE